MWNFLTSASDMASWPASYPKEVCFIGRSNVGKSSLINAITNNQYLARVSKTPGRTRLLNFFVEDAKVLVDLPGYGYAKMSLAKQKEVIKMIEDYLSMRKQLIKVFLLIDAKVGPTQDDLLMLGHLQALHLPVIVVITKSDKANQSEIHATKKAVSAFSDDFVVTSTYKSTNIAKLKKIIAAQF